MTIHTHDPQWAILPRFIDGMRMPHALKEIAKLKKRGIDAPDEPDTMRSDQIDTLENVFQARTGQLVEQHLGELVSAIKTEGTIEPLVLWRCGAHPILIDGHHRLEAYRRVERERGEPMEIPVTWFRGTVEEAAVKAAMLNSRAKLAMSPTERSDHAWRMVLSERFMVPQIVRAASVSRRNVQNMRRAMEQLGKAAARFSTWAKARNAWNGLGGLTEDEERDVAEEMAQQFASRMAKEFTTKLAHHPDIAARTLAIYFGRRSPEVIQLWRQEIEAAGGELEGDEE